MEDQYKSEYLSRLPINTDYIYRLNKTILSLINKIDVEFGFIKMYTTKIDKEKFDIRINRINNYIEEIRSLLEE